MIFTIGHRESYLSAFAERGRVWKLGRGSKHAQPGYVGGYAFRTADDARRRIAEARYHEFEVFGLGAAWNRDTSPSSSGWWHHLRRDAQAYVLAAPEVLMHFAHAAGRWTPLALGQPGDLVTYEAREFVSRPPYLKRLQVHGVSEARVGPPRSIEDEGWFPPAPGWIWAEEPSPFPNLQVPPKNPPRVDYWASPSSREGIGRYWPFRLVIVAEIEHVDAPKRWGRDPTEPELAAQVGVRILASSPLDRGEPLWSWEGPPTCPKCESEAAEWLPGGGSKCLECLGTQPPLPQ